MDVWWGDERFVPADDDDRNEGAARRALLDVVGVPAARVHAMPPSDGAFAEPEDAAAWYAGELAAAAAPGSDLPRFDVLLLGIGPEGHTASIFPESPAAHDERPVFAVRDCPKPPPTRVSLGFSAINTADEVWLVVAGEDKAPAVARAVAGASPGRAPRRRRARRPGHAVVARRRRGGRAARVGLGLYPRRQAADSSPGSGPLPRPLRISPQEVCDDRSASADDQRPADPPPAPPSRAPPPAGRGHDPTPGRCPPRSTRGRSRGGTSAAPVPARSTGTSRRRAGTRAARARRVTDRL